MCGSSAVEVIDAIPDHKDIVPGDKEHAGVGLMCTCVSRSLPDKLVVKL